MVSIATTNEMNALEQMLQNMSTQIAEQTKTLEQTIVERLNKAMDKSFDTLNTSLDETIAKIKKQNLRHLEKQSWYQDRQDVKSKSGIGRPNPNGEPRTSNTSALLIHPRLNQLEVDLDRMEEYLALTQMYSFKLEVAGFGISVMKEFYRWLGFDNKCHPQAHLRYIRESITDLKQFVQSVKQRNVDGFIERNLVRLEGKVSRITPRIKKAAELERVQSRFKGFVAYRIQRWYRQCKHEKATQAATTIFCWWRRQQLGRHFQKQRAARLIQRWRISIVNRRKEDKLEDAALSSPFRDRGQPLQQLSRRTRHRHSKRYHSKRKRGQKRGRPPNSSSQQLTSQQSIERRENVSGYALSNSGRSSNRGNVFGSVHNNSSGHITAGPYVLGKDLRNRKLNRRGTEIGEALQFESSSRGNAISNSPQAGSESSHSPTQPISSPTKKSRRRRRRHRVRRNRKKSILSNKDEASTSHRHTPIASHPSFDANLSTMSMSNFCDGISQQYQQASPKDRNLLIKFMCHMVIQTIDNQAIEPSTIDNIESSISTPTTVSSNPSSNESTEDESEDAVSLELQSHVAEVEANLNQHLADFNESFSSINNVDSHTPKSTLTSLNAELPSSASIITEETSTRHEKPMSYLNALIGTTTNFG